MFNWIKDNPIFFLLIFLAIAAPSLFVGAMRVIFYIVIGVVILMLILSFLFRAKIARLQKDMEQQMRGGGNGAGHQGFRGFYTSNQHSRRQEQQQEGDVKIFQQGKHTDKKVAKDVGDYVDFEELKEKK